MPSQPTESPAEDIRNALAILGASGHVCYVGNELRATYQRADIEAVLARLRSAVTKLEATH